MPATKNSTKERLNSSKSTRHKNPQTDKRVKEFLKAVPKVELHVHVEATVKPQSVLKLIKRNKVDSSITTLNQVRKMFDIHSLKEFIDLFLFVQSCLKKMEDLLIVMDDAIKYCKDNNIQYCEFHFAPSKFIQLGFHFNDMMDILYAKIEEAEKKHGIIMRFLIDVSRTFGPENAMHNVNYTLNANTKYIIGIGLGGNEATGPAEDYEKPFAAAREAGLKVVAHSGEAVGPFSMWQTIKYLGAMRIGHGTSAMFDNKLMDELKERFIPLEICPTSNIYTAAYVSKLEDHPIRLFYDKGVPLSINSDDPTFFNASLSDEYFNAYKHINFNLHELEQIIYNSIDQSFYHDKKGLKKSFKNQIIEVKTEYTDLFPKD